MVRTQCLHCHGWDSIPGRELRSHKLRGVAKKEYVAEGQETGAQILGFAI